MLGINGSFHVIQNFAEGDQGNYVCNCSNVAGVEEAYLTLTLYGKLKGIWNINWISDELILG